MYCHSKRYPCEIKCICDSCDERKSCPDVCLGPPSEHSTHIFRSTGSIYPWRGGPYKGCLYLKDWLTRIRRTVGAG